MWADFGRDRKRRAPILRILSLLRIDAPAGVEECLMAKNGLNVLMG